MPNNFTELRLLLECTSQENRNALGKIIEAPFGNDPNLLCDHLCYLRAGMIGQLFDGRDYKQLVTDVGDRVCIDWSRLVAVRHWEHLSAADIEAAVIEHVEPHDSDVEDTEYHLPEQLSKVLKDALIEQVVRRVPLFGDCAGPFLGGALDIVFSQLSTDWRKLLATVIYVNRVIRPKTNRV
jgi:hypothetical protein